LTVTGCTADRPEIEFAVGDAVVSPRHGVGIVVERGVRAHDRALRECYTIELERHGLRLSIPLDGAARTGLRSLASLAEVERALDALGALPRPLVGDWRTRQKEAARKLGSGELVSRAELVRDLTHAAGAKPLAVNDRELCKIARELLEGELTAVLGESAGREIGRRLADRAGDPCPRR
jgi:CarD family transcriptional regulator